MVLMILESGAILSCTTISLLAMYVDKRLAGEIVSAALGQIDVSVLPTVSRLRLTSIQTLVPTSILLRVALSKRHHETFSEPPVFAARIQRDRSSSTDHTSVNIGVDSNAVSGDSEVFEMRKIDVSR